MNENNRREFLNELAGLGLLMIIPGGLIIETPAAPKPQAPPSISHSQPFVRKSSYNFVGSETPDFLDKYVGERLAFYIEVWHLDVADIYLDLKQLGPGRYNSRFTINLRNIYSVLTRYGELFIDSDLVVGKQENRYRLKPEKTHIEHTYKGNLYQRIYTFDYEKSRYRLRKYKNGESTYDKERSFRRGRVYDDPSSAFWNLRCNIYGEFDPGQSFKIRCLRFAGMRRYEGKFLTKEEQEQIMSPLIKRYPNVKSVMGAKLSKKIFLGEPDGMMYLGFDKHMTPLFGYIPDIPTIGNVAAHRHKKES